jgi:Ca-activated chloride channel family protein
MPTSRIPTIPPATSRQTFGLFAVIESQRMILPLKGVECDFSAVSGIIEASMTQIFRQENEKALDCEYVFPLPADASVYFCEADINGRTIRAQVRERQEARKIAAEKKAAGFRTALVEAERENLFTLSLGNVQPDDLVIIRLKYFQTLRSLAGKASIEIPFCPGIRYIPGSPLLRSNKGTGVADDTDQVPDASRISPVRIDSEHPDAAYVEVRGTLDGTFVNEKDISSPSHRIDVQRMGDKVQISLSDKGDLPDRDFVLRWTEKAAEAISPRAWLCQKGEETYALLEIRAPVQASSERASADFYFLVDRSGSMAGQKWNKAAQALLNCMKVLGPADRAMVTFFESRFQDFAERPMSAYELLCDPRFQNLAKLGTSGGTEMRPALKHVLDLAARHRRNASKNLILITDAQIGNEAAILELMKDARDFPVHCFGIDTALNDSLLVALCRQQGGTFHSMHPNDDIEEAVSLLGRTLGQPVLLDLQLSKGWELADAVIPNLYAGQIHYVSARSSGVQPLEIAARTAASQREKIQSERHAATFEAPYLNWCRSRINRLAAEGNESSAVALSIKSNLICPLTAFIAWDESEKVPLATQNLVQPCIELAERVGFCGTRHAAAVRMPQMASLAGEDLGERQSLLASFRLDSDEELYGCRGAVASDEIDLRRQLSDLCHKAGVPNWVMFVKLIFAWVAEASGSERLQRIEALAKLLKELKVQAERHVRLPGARKQKEIEEVQARLHQSLKAFVENLQVRK